MVEWAQRGRASARPHDHGTGVRLSKVSLHPPLPLRAHPPPPNIPPRFPRDAIGAVTTRRGIGSSPSALGSGRLIDGRRYQEPRHSRTATTPPAFGSRFGRGVVI